MQVSVAGLRRNIKNIAHNYTEPQKKVREATSNDPWGPPSTLMSEIADLTYNITAFAEIMEMLWKRLNDHGKNWRHVYKSLVLIEYLIKTGSERVAQQCKENLFAIQTLKDFQYFEENKDQGLNVREKAKQLVTLLGSEERLRNERARALKARERFAQTVSGFGSSDSNETTPTSPVFSANHFGNGEMPPQRTRTNSELENARPHTLGEEELQLQLALAMSKEEAEQEEKRRRSDDIRLQMALSQSEQEIGTDSPTPKKDKASALVDLLDVDLGGAAALPVIAGASALPPADPWAPVQTSSRGPWSAASSGMASPQDPWGPAPASAPVGVSDPWLSNTVPAAKADPWASNQGTSSTPTFSGAMGGQDEDEFDTISKRQGSTTPNPSAFNMDSLGSSLLQPTPSNTSLASGKMTPKGFLGENSSLVNLDNLLPSANARHGTTPPMLGAVGGMNGNGNGNAVPNPFVPSPAAAGRSLLSSGPVGGQAVNPFHAQNTSMKPSINELRQQQHNVQGVGSFQIQGQQPNVAQNNPWSPVKTDNPFK